MTSVMDLDAGVSLVSGFVSGVGGGILASIRSLMHSFCFGSRDVACSSDCFSIFSHSFWRWLSWVKNSACARETMTRMKNKTNTLRNDFFMFVRRYGHILYPLFGMTVNEEVLEFT